MELHQNQLRGINLPEALWPRLYEKLVPSEILDVGETFEIQREDTASLVVRKGKAVGAHSDVFLARHVFFSDGSAEAKEKLEASPSLVERLEKLMMISGDENAGEALESAMCSLLASHIGVDEKEANRLLLDSNFEIVNAILRHEGNHTDSGRAQSVPAQLHDVSFEEFTRSLRSSLGDETPEDEAQVRSLYQNFLKKRSATHEEDRKCVEHVTTRYSWHQEGEDGTVTVTVAVPKSAKKKDISSKLTRHRWTFGVKGAAPLIDGELFAACVADESYWSFGEPGVVVMTIQKHKVEVGWEELIKDEVQVDERQIEEQAAKLQQMAKRRVPVVLQQMWLFNQTYQAVTREGW